MSLSENQEEWRPVNGFETLYEVSSWGHVKSLAHDSWGGPGYRQLIHFDEKILKTFVSANGYVKVTLFKDGKHSQKYVHRLVAEAFIPNPDNLPVVDHIDSDKLNSNVSNLRWCTTYQNVHYAIENGTLSLEENTKHLQTDEAKTAQKKACSRPVVRSDGKVYESMAAAARDLGCARQAVGQCVRGISKTCMGYTFRLCE